MEKLKSKPRKSAAKKKAEMTAGPAQTPEIPQEEVRHLYLMRHAKASKSKKHDRDLLRPLTKRGKKDVKKIKKQLKEKNIQPDLVLCSPSVRTIETLERLKKAFGHAEVVFLDSLYLAQAEEMMYLLRQTESDRHEVLVVGHNPGLADFVTMFCHMENDFDSDFPTSALACIECACDWAHLDAEPIHLVDFIRSEG